jgi:hypothetical protein
MHSTIIFYGYHIIDKNINPDTIDIIKCFTCKPDQIYIKDYSKPQWFKVVCCDGVEELFYGFCISTTSKVTTYTLDKFELYDTMLKNYKFKIDKFDKMKEQLQDFYNEYKNQKSERFITLRKIRNDYYDTLDIIDSYANYYSDSESEESEKLEESEESEEYTYGIHVFNEICICWNL